MLGYELVKKLIVNGLAPLSAMAENLHFWRNIVAGAETQWKLLDDYERKSPEGQALFERLKGYRLLFQATAVDMAP